MAIRFNEGYMDAMRRITDKVNSGELTPEEGESLSKEYEDAKIKFDSHISEVREIEAELDRIANTNG